MTTLKARIYRPAKNAMQSGRAKTRYWLLEYDPAPKQIDTLMGWVGSATTLNQLRLRFNTQQEAEAFAKENNIPYEVELPKLRKPKLKSYADNFRFDNIETYSPKPVA